MYDKICIINNIGLIQITHVFKIFVKIYRRILGSYVFFLNRVSFVFRGGKILDEKTMSIQLEKWDERLMKWVPDQG